MLLAAVLLLTVGLTACAWALGVEPGRDLSPLFENGLIVALTGLVLSIGVAIFEAARGVVSLAGGLIVQ